MPLDHIAFEVLRHSLVTLVDEMGQRLFRASFSPPVNQGRDYSIAVFDRQGRLVTAGHWDMPIHYGTFQFTIDEVMRVMSKEGIYEGDIYLFNDPWRGGTHNQDIRALKPVFHQGELVAWLVAMAHWADVGGPVPGTFNPQAADAYAEGLRIPPIKIYERGRRIDSTIELILSNIRVPDERRGDLHAQIQTLFTGEERLLGLYEKHGVATLDECYADLWDYSEKLLRAETEQLPNGRYSWEDWIDQDSVHPDKPPVVIRLTMEVRDGNLLFDFTDSDPAPMGPVGSPLPTTWSGVLLSVLNLFPGIPHNFGLLRVIDVTTKPGTVTHVEHPTPCSGMAAGALEKIICSILGAMGLADPSRKSGAFYNLTNLIMGGWDPRFGRDYVMYGWAPGGYGGTVRGDMPIPTNNIYGPGIRQQPVEVLERFYPMLITSFGLRPGSAGAGKHNGGWGTETSWVLTHGTARVGMMGDRRRSPIWGVDGGQPGAFQNLVVNPGSPEERELGMQAANEWVKAGDDFVLLTGGGGGYGNPLERNPGAVLDDVGEELLTVEQALERYGVVIEAVDPDIFDYRLDAEATVAERARRQG